MQRRGIDCVRGIGALVTARLFLACSQFKIQSEDFFVTGGFDHLHKCRISLEQHIPDLSGRNNRWGFDFRIFRTSNNFFDIILLLAVGFKGFERNFD